MGHYRSESCAPPSWRPCGTQIQAERSGGVFTDEGRKTTQLENETQMPQLLVNQVEMEFSPRVIQMRTLQDHDFDA
jgi:hypothetical protein